MMDPRMMQQGLGGGMQMSPQIQNMIRMALMQRMMQGQQGQGSGVPAGAQAQNRAGFQQQAPVPQQQGMQGGYSPNNAAMGNPQQRQMMDQNQFMQRLNQRIGGRR